MNNIILKCLYFPSFQYQNLHKVKKQELEKQECSVNNIVPTMQLFCRFFNNCLKGPLNQQPRWYNTNLEGQVFCEADDCPLRNLLEYAVAIDGGFLIRSRALVEFELNSSQNLNRHIYYKSEKPNNSLIWGGSHV